MNRRWRITAFAGGRPGLISAATGAMVLVLAWSVHTHGVRYIIVTGMNESSVGDIGNIVGALPSFIFPFSKQLKKRYMRRKTGVK